MPVSGGEPLIIVIIVAISLRWWVAWFGTCWSKGQSVSRKDLVPSVFLYSTTRSRSADLSPSTKAPCSRSRSSHGARIVSTLIEPSLLQHGDDVALLDGLTLLDLDLLDRARPRCLYGDLHLHGLEDDHSVAGGNPLARPRGDLEHDPRDVRLD